MPCLHCHVLLEAQAVALSIMCDASTLLPIIWVCVVPTVPLDNTAEPASLAKTLEIPCLSQHARARSTSPTVQAAWARGQELAVHGLIYHPGEGLLKVRLAQICKHRRCFVRCSEQRQTACGRD